MSEQEGGLTVLVVRVDGGARTDELGGTLLLPFGRGMKHRAERLRLSCVGWHACLESRGHLLDLARGDRLKERGRVGVLRHATVNGGVEHLPDVAARQPAVAAAPVAAAAVR